MISRIQFVALLTLLVSFLAVPARATRVDRGASGNGVIDPDCVADITTNPACVQFAQLSSTTAHWENFSLGSDGTTAVLDNNFELFMVPTTGPVTFQLTGPSVAFGSFMCGLDGDFGAIDSGMLASLNNFCNTFPVELWQRSVSAPLFRISPGRSRTPPERRLSAGLWPLERAGLWLALRLAAPLSAPRLR